MDMIITLMELGLGLTMEMVENVRQEQQKMKLVEQLILVGKCETCQLFIVSLTLAVFRASLCNSIE